MTNARDRSECGSQMQKIRRLIDQISQRSKIPKSGRWRAWKVLRDIAGGKFEEFPQYLYSEALGALEKMLLSIPPKTRDLVPRLPVEREGQEETFPYDWVQLSVVIHDFRRTCHAKIVGNIGAELDESEEILARDREVFEETTKIFKRARNTAIAKRDAFALRRAEAEYERVMLELDRGRDHIMTPFPRAAANDAQLFS